MHTKKEKLFKVDYIYGYILPFLVALGGLSSKVCK